MSPLSVARYLSFRFSYEPHELEGRRLNEVFQTRGQPEEEREAVYRACDAHLARVLLVLRPEWLIGVGEFAAKRGEEIAASIPDKLEATESIKPPAVVSRHDAVALLEASAVKMALSTCGT